MDTPMGQTDHDLALAFVRDQWQAWREKGVIRGEEFDRVNATYQELQRQSASGQTAANPLMLPSSEVCWNCKAPVDATSYCGACGAPADTDAVDRLRYLVCLCHEIKNHERAGRIDLSTAHGCLADANGRIAALRRKLDGQRIPSAIPVVKKTSAERFTEAPPPSLDESPPSPVAPRRNFLEMLLDPRSIQWLLASGAAVLVLGVVIWLAATVFDKPIYVAVLLGVANALLLAGGWALIRLTRYQLAGRAVTLLACLLMPLNMWFYNYNHLITVADHLWLAALVCCRVVCGFGLTAARPDACLRLRGRRCADGLAPVGRQIGAAPLGSVGAGGVSRGPRPSVHPRRTRFPEGAGPFSRRRFGLPFFWSGQAVLGAGLLLVLGAQLTGTLLLFDTSFNDFYYHTLEFIAGPISSRTWAANCWRWRSSRREPTLTPTPIWWCERLAFTFIWRSFVFSGRKCCCSIWPSSNGPTCRPSKPTSSRVALTGLIANFALTALLPPQSALGSSGPALALALCIVPLLLGVALYFWAVTAPVGNLWQHSLELVVCRCAGDNRRRLPRRRLPPSKRAAVAGDGLSFRLRRGRAARRGRPAADAET